MDLNKDYYKTLGVDKNSDEKEIKKEYRKKANKYHPDKYNGDDTIFKNINEAYQTLGNNEKKQKYDFQSPHGKNFKEGQSGFESFFGGGGNPFGFNFSFGGGDDFDPFEMFFRKKDFHEELDIRIDKEITLEDIYNNNEIKIKYKRKVTCDICKGTGFDPDSESHECDVCDSSGKVWEPTTGFSKCKYCQGTGKIHTGTCNKCNGDKTIDREEEFNINNVYKITNSDTKYVRGFGHQSKYYLNRRGNLILNIIYRQNDKYVRKNNGLYYKLDLHYEDAINGIDYDYKHLDNKMYKIKIPPKTKDGDTLKMSNMGLLDSFKNRESLFILINIIIDYEKIK